MIGLILVRSGACGHQGRLRMRCPSDHGLGVLVTDPEDPVGEPGEQPGTHEKPDQLQHRGDHLLSSGKIDQPRGSASLRRVRQALDAIPTATLRILTPP
jgi:hypothetical protein